MKCQYQGTWTRAGCNEDAIPGTNFCHAHREQGPVNQIRDRVTGWGCLVGLALFMVLVTLAPNGICESQESKCLDVAWTLDDPTTPDDEHRKAFRYWHENCR